MQIHASHVAVSVAAWLFVAALRPIWSWKLRKLPGDWRWPILGHLPGLEACGQAGLVEWTMRMKKKYGSVFTLWTGSRPGVMISDPELCRRIAWASSNRASIEFFSIVVGEQHRIVHGGLLGLNPKENSTKFRIMRRAFESVVLSPAALATHTPAVQECVTRLVARLSNHATSGQPVEMATLLPHMTMNVIGFVAFGIDLRCLDPDQDPNQVQLLDDSWVNKPPTSPEFGRGLTRAAQMWFRLADLSQGTPWKALHLLFPHLFKPICYLANWFPDKLARDELKANQQLTQGVKALIQAWKAQRAAKASGTDLGSMAISDTGFLSRMMETIETEAGVSELDVVAQAFVMVLAGYETTASALSSILCLMCRKPETQVKVQEEVDNVLKGKVPTPEDVEQLPYLRALVEEGLRMHGPADSLLREMTPTNKDWDLGNGHVIPAGAMVWVDLHGVANDPAIWPRADEFLPERWLPGNEHLSPKSENAHMPFGGGARKCPGYKFALLEIHLTLARLFQHFSFSTAEGQPPAFWRSGFLWAPRDVWVTVKRRVS